MGVTKGALYYHFKSKKALGYAVVEAVIAPDVRAKWLRPLQRGKDPIDALIEIVQGISVRPEDVRGGRSLNNLNQEMSPLLTKVTEQTYEETTRALQPRRKVAILRRRLLDKVPVSDVCEESPESESWRYAMM